MKVEIMLDETLSETSVVVHARRMDDEVSELMRRLSAQSAPPLLGYDRNEIVPLNQADILRIFTEKQQVIVEVPGRRLVLRHRLYELEALLDGAKFVRISNSEIVNFEHVRSLDMSIGGTITLKLAGGNRAFVSRRYMDKIKRHLGL